MSMLAVTSKQHYILSPKLRWYTGVGSQINLKSISVSPNSASSFPPSGLKKCSRGLSRTTCRGHGITGGKETLKHLILKCQDLDLNPSTTLLLTYLHIQQKKKCYGGYSLNYKVLLAFLSIP